MPNDANFCADGIVWPNRKPHPALYEFKHLAQPVRVEMVDVRGRVRIVNKRDFTSLDDLSGEWEMTVDGIRVQSGNLPRLNIAPGESMDVTLDLKCDHVGERFLNFRFYQRRHLVGKSRTPSRVATDCIAIARTKTDAA